MSLAALKQRKLARIVHHSKLFQQSLDDLTSRGAWAYVQVLGCVLWEIERGATLHSTGLPPSIIRTSFLWRWNRHRARQLELHFNEPCVGTILVLWGKVKILDWKKKKKKKWKCTDMSCLFTTHHVHEQIAVDLRVVFLHLLLNICGCQLLLSQFNLFILEETARSKCYTSRCQCSPQNHNRDKSNTPAQEWTVMSCNFKNVMICNN